ncbi:MAG: hypothetical protein DYG89_35130 [Caldilinea sp. CFX5]|nr:hypothetical protein [Caldilinea sp. CFX5]
MEAEALQSITFNLPKPLYHQVVKRAQRINVLPEDELVTMVASALSLNDDIAETTADAMAQLAFLDDDELWRAANIKILPEENERMQFLTLKRQIKGLNAAEQTEVEDLLQRYDHVMLVRAQAMALLHERGFDLSTLLNPSRAA